MARIMATCCSAMELALACLCVLADDAPNRINQEESRPAVERSIRFYPGFSGYARRVTCTSAEAQRWFDQGIQLLYGYNHDEAIRSFEKAAAIDPSCAMAWWGSAYARGLHINNPVMGEEQSRLANEAAQKGDRGTGRRIGRRAGPDCRRPSAIPVAGPRGPYPA